MNIVFHHIKYPLVMTHPYMQNSKNLPFTAGEGMMRFEITHYYSLWKIARLFFPSSHSSESVSEPLAFCCILSGEFFSPCATLLFPSLPTSGSHPPAKPIPHTCMDTSTKSCSLCHHPLGLGIRCRYSFSVSVILLNFPSCDFFFYIVPELRLNIYSHLIFAKH